MNDIADLPKIPLEELSVSELKLLVANARRGGRIEMAQVVLRELARRGAKLPEDMIADAPAAPEPRTPAWPQGLAASIAALLALSAAGGWFLYREAGSSRQAPVPITVAKQMDTAPAAPSPATPERAQASAQTLGHPATSSLASRDSASSSGIAAASQPSPLAEASEPDRARSGSADGGRLAMARSDPGVLAGAAGGAELLAVSGSEVERASDCADAAVSSEAMLCNDALRVARSERRARISPAPVRIVVARNMPALPLLASGRR